MRSSYFLKYTVPSAQKSAEPAPKMTPAGDAAFVPPEMLSMLTATIPEKPSSSPTILAVERGSPRINHARTPTSMGCR